MLAREERLHVHLPEVSDEEDVGPLYDLKGAREACVVRWQTQKG